MGRHLLLTMLIRSSVAFGVTSSPMGECNGFEKEWTECANPSCDQCIPRNCEFEAWGDWYPSTGCVGLKYRERNVNVSNNECGKPCHGHKTDATRHIPDECKVLLLACLLDDWGGWSACSSTNDQSIRARGVKQDASVNGRACTEVLSQTRPCGSTNPVTDCTFDNWQEWTTCSATCGVGRATRLRHTSEQSHGGQPCAGSLLETQECTHAACPDQDCALSEWSVWSFCNDVHRQKHRSRNVLKPALGRGKCGKAGTLILKETAGCQVAPVENCVLSGWSRWSECDKTCGGGQRTRSRKVTQQAQNGGTCHSADLRQLMPCSTELCAEKPKDCQLGAWSGWRECSATCGAGTRSRARAIDIEAEDGGQGCNGALNEVVTCEAPGCLKVDCKWGDWMQWSACSCSCGGGNMYRNRVIEAPPRHGGAPCEPKLKSEAAPCNVMSCEEACVDGLWGPWSRWSECSSNCDTGFRSRARSVEREPNACGKPVTGLEQDFEACTTPSNITGQITPCVKDLDCMLSDWAEWSSCSCTCYGVTERGRFVRQFKSGKGRPCDGSLRELKQCNPFEGAVANFKCGVHPPQNCELSAWEPWGQCDRSCGGGQTRRSRVVATPPRYGGLPCNDTLELLAPCNTQSCDVEKPCKDCQWGLWSSWSKCPKCGGQRWRHREIAIVPDHCGTPCDLKFTKEVSSCPKLCDDTRVCSWTEWSDPTVCEEGCGARTQIRNRGLAVEPALPGASGLFDFLAATDGKCSGTQLNVSVCPYRSCKPECEPRHCAFAAWSDWSGGTCTGLCERRREMARTNNECGAPCEGAIVDTRRCPVTCNLPVPCHFAPWGGWSQCTSQSGQKERTRVIDVYPERGGAACTGALKETAACMEAGIVSDCQTTAWSAWSRCPKPCGGSVQTRSRRIVQNAIGGGLSCNESLEEAQQCNTNACDLDADCVYSAWEAWSGCDADEQKFRSRKIASFAKANGKPCLGAMQETVTCDVVVVNCDMSAWTEWSQCDKPCGGGQRQQTRQIARFPLNGGTRCEPVLVATTGCNSQSCDASDCQVGDWEPWGECSSTCGTGVSSRSRHVNSLRQNGGVGCDEPLTVTRPCNNAPCDIQDCVWNFWSEWSSCTCSCNGGQRTRTRSIKIVPHGGGQACAAENQEVVEPCNTGPCDDKNCINGRWGAWTPWSGCSSSCGGGTTFRTRLNVQMASECGTPALGDDRETHFCNVGVACEASEDCEFSHWDEWSDCSTTCNGVKHRSRGISKYGRGAGTWCMGALKQTFACNVANAAQGVAAPAGCGTAPTVDCELSAWSGWSVCSEECGGGQHSRSRNIVRSPEHMGAACTAVLEDVQECNRNPCAVKALAVDCKYGDWNEWGACSKCAGEIRRFRTIIHYAANGGNQCMPFYHQEISNCTRSCHEEQFCTWDAWTSWSACTTKCGPGKKSRRRSLAYTTNVNAPKPASIEQLTALTAKYDSLYQRAESLEARHLQELAISFGAGVLSLMVGFRVSRLVGRSPAAPTQ